MSDQLIICGMHRSGTSMVASVLQQSGLDIGTTDARPELGQPRGHFEDRDFWDLHEAMLARAGRSCFTADDASLAGVAEDFEDRARELIAARAGRALWGWKDPRTCLFLELWERLLPNARFLIVYRHPVDVALSLWRRNIDLEVRQAPELAFDAWTRYNRRLLACRERNLQRTFVAHTPALVAGLPGSVRRLAARLELPLRAGDYRNLVLPDEWAPSCPPPRPDWETLIPDALAVYARLEACADLPSAGEPVPSGRQQALLQGSELLLHALISTARAAGAPPPLALREEYVRLRLQEEELRHRLRAAAEAIDTLRAIEGSWSFALVRAWWWLRRSWRRVVG